MLRELIWLEDSTFAAWACKACTWILPSSRGVMGPSEAVKEAFEKHDCAKFARIADGKAKRPRDSRSA